MRVFLLIVAIAQTCATYGREDGGAVTVSEYQRDPVVIAASLPVNVRAWMLGSPTFTVSETLALDQAITIPAGVQYIEAEADEAFTFTICPAIRPRIAFPFAVF